MEEKIILPDFVLASLYKDSLIELSTNKLDDGDASVQPKQQRHDAGNENAAITAEQPERKPLARYLGGNKKGIGVFVKCANEAFLPEADYEFLMKMLASCQLTANDIAIFNIAKIAAPFTETREKYSLKYFLLFGIESADIRLPMTIPHYQVQSYAGITVVTAPPLQMLNSEAEAVKKEKFQLWQSLKRCFGV